MPLSPSGYSTQYVGHASSNPLPLLIGRKDLNLGLQHECLNHCAMRYSALCLFQFLVEAIPLCMKYFSHWIRESENDYSPVAIEHTPKVVDPSLSLWSYDCSETASKDTETHISWPTG